MNAPLFDPHPQTPTAPTRLCIVRHGETAWNAENRVQGQTDVALNATGLKQAAAAGQGLRNQQFAAIYSSDLSRAHDTAAAIAANVGVPVQLEAGLRERHYGSFQGLTQAELAALHPDDYARYQARDIDFEYGHGESLRQFATRVTTTVERLAAAHAGQQILLVAHGGVLDVIYRQATGMPLHQPRDFKIPNAAFNWIEIDAAAGWHLKSWAEQEHLASTLELVLD